MLSLLCSEGRGEELTEGEKRLGVRVGKAWRHERTLLFVMVMYSVQFSSYVSF